MDDKLYKYDAEAAAVFRKPSLHTKGVAAQALEMDDLESIPMQVME